MKQIIVTALLIFSIFHSIGQTSQSAKLSLSISEGLNDKNLIVFTVKNIGDEVVVTDNFNHSNINKVHIYSPSGNKISYDYIICHSRMPVRIPPGESKSWEYDMSDFFNPFVSRQDWPSGIYNIEWEVNGTKTDIYQYEKKGN